MMRLRLLPALLLLALVWAPSTTAGAVSVGWFDHFGGTSQDFCSGVAATPTAVFTAGQGRPAESITEDNFVRRSTLDGAPEWTVGIDDSAYQVLHVAANGDGVFVYASAPLVDDVALFKFSALGDLEWTRVFGSTRNETPSHVAVSSSGVYVTGRTEGAFPGETRKGPSDVFIRKYDFEGNVRWTDQFGTGQGDTGNTITAGRRAVYVAGPTNGAFPGSKDKAGPDVFVRAYSHAGRAKWTTQFGSQGVDSAFGLATTPEGIAVAGIVGSGHLPRAHGLGGTDGFVALLSPRGDYTWGRHVGGGDDDEAYSVVLHGNGLVAGGQTNGEVAAPGLGDVDAFLESLSLRGARRDVFQFGSAGQDSVRSADTNSSLGFICGFVEGPMEGEVGWDGEEGFLAKLIA